MNKIKVSLLLSLIILFLVGCVSIPIGDGNKIKVGKDGIEFSDKEGNVHTIAFDTENGKLYIDGFGLEEILGLGGTVEIPERFPPDIPIPEDARVYKANDTNGIITLAYETDQSVDRIDKMYTKYYQSNVFIEKPVVSEEDDENGKMKTFLGLRKDGTLDVRFFPSQIMEDGTTVGIVFHEGNKEPSKEFPGDMFDVVNPFEWFTGDMFNGSFENLPDEDIDNDGSSEQMTGDMSSSRDVDEFIQHYLPSGFPIPENAKINQAEALLGIILLAFEADTSPEAVEKRYKSYFSSEDFIDQPTFIEKKIENVLLHIIEGNHREGKFNLRYSPSNNINGGSEVIVIFEKN